MDRKLTPTLALIVAGGLAAGIGLARPSTAAPEAANSAVEPTDQAPGAPVDGEYRTGNRPGNRGGTPAAEPDTGGGAATPEAAAIAIEGFAFAGPASVSPGTSLTVTNLDAAPHTLTFRSGEVDTGNLAGGAATTVEAPTNPGTYAFFCAIHPSMEGQIVVAG